MLASLKNNLTDPNNFCLFCNSLFAEECSASKSLSVQKTSDTLPPLPYTLFCSLTLRFLFYTSQYYVSNKSKCSPKPSENLPAKHIYFRSPQWPFVLPPKHLFPNICSTTLVYYKSNGNLKEHHYGFYCMCVNYV